MVHLGDCRVYLVAHGTPEESPRFALKGSVKGFIGPYKGVGNIGLYLVAPGTL